MKRALLSVSDKSGIVDFGRELVRRGWEVVSTGGTAGALRGAGLPVTDVAEITGHPEMMDGRVKTLHPAVHAGILARRSTATDMEALVAQGYGPIDLVVVNLYPFRETVAHGGVGVAEAMGKVDIGGPTMIRAAAKSHPDVLVVVDPDDYDAVLGVLDGEGEDEPKTRRALAAKVFRHVSEYDGAVAEYLEGDSVGTGKGAAADGVDGDPDAPTWPARLSVELSKVDALRYGENPDQPAAFYRLGESVGIAALEQHHGKALSYNNILDLDGALLSLAPFALSPRPAVCIVKHTTPCGLAIDDSLRGAWDKALRCDPISAFGSVIAVNRPVDRETAQRISELFVECVVAPAFDDDAMAVLTGKKNIRLLTFPADTEAQALRPFGPGLAGAPESVRSAACFLSNHGRLPEARTLRSVYGGVLVQSPPTPPFYGIAEGNWEVVTTRSPDAREMDDLRFAWAAVYGVKSNAILLARDGATLGIGAGQMSRVDSSRIAVRKAADQELSLNGAALASDAFFPFRDGVDAAAASGVKAIVQPGGSIRDEEVIGAANEHGIAMVFTGRRLFRH